MRIAPLSTRNDSLRDTRYSANIAQGYEQQEIRQSRKVSRTKTRISSYDLHNEIVVA